MSVKPNFNLKDNRCAPDKEFINGSCFIFNNN